MELPVIIVNFKLYEKGTGQCAVDLAKIHEQVAKETGASIAVAVNPLDLRAVVEAVEIPVFIQHVDDVDYGSHTGYLSPRMVKESGAYGTLINHAERILEDGCVRDIVERCRDLELFSVVCAHSPKDAEKMVAYEPDLIAVEPPELIGGDISVSKADPAIVERSVELVGENRVLVGAGVKDSEDVRIARALGACGILVASGVVKVEDPYSALLDLVSGLQ